MPGLSSRKGRPYTRGGGKILEQEGKMKNQVNGGVSLCSLLTVAFVVLKLCKVIEWDWWLVLWPLWVPWAVVAAVGVILALVIVAIKVVRYALKGIE